MKKYLPLILFATALAILAFSYGVWRQRQREFRQVVNDDLPSTNLSSVAAPDSPPQPLDLTMKEVKHSSNSLAETEAVQLTNAFLMAFNQRSYSGMATLFAPATAGRADFATILNEAIKENSVRPITFTFENIEVKTDSSVLVTVQETRADDAGNKRDDRRIIELIPLDGKLKIGAYFQPDSTDTISGFAN